MVNTNCIKLTCNLWQIISVKNIIEPRTDECGNRHLIHNFILFRVPTNAHTQHFLADLKNKTKY